MLNSDQISKRLFKKDLGVGDTSTVREFFEEPFSSGVSIKPDQILAQFDQVPETAPAGMAHDEVQGVVQRKIDVALTPVSGVSGAFQHNDLKDAVPFNHGDGSYNYIIKDNLDNPVSFGQGDWVIDTYAGILIFYDVVPTNMPPKISFYRYVGNKGVEVEQTYFIVPDIAGRDAISVGVRQEGIKSYVINTKKEYQLRDGIDNVNWFELESATLTPRDEVLPNNTPSGLLTDIYDITAEESKKLIYRADRGSSYESGTILIDHKDGNVYSTEYEGALNNLGVTYDFNINGNIIEMSYTVDDNVDDVVFSFVMGGMVAGGVVDNLGNHTATQNLNLNGYPLVDESRTEVYIGVIPFPQTLGDEGDIFVQRSGVMVQEPYPGMSVYMSKAVYDPNTVGADAFNMDNHLETATNKHYSTVERDKLVTIENGAQVNPTTTDALTEGTTNFYYTEVKVSANTDVVANTAARHDHSNKAVLDAIIDDGSGQIITGSERIKLIGIEVGAQVNPADTDALTEGATNLYYTDVRVSANIDVAANTAVRHDHNNKAILDDITDLGSGIIISVDERSKLVGIDEGAEVNQSDAEIKTQYENNADTNEYTDVEKANVATIPDKVTNDHIHLNKVILSPDGTLVAGAWMWEIVGSDLVMSHYDGAAWNEIKSFTP